MVEDCHRLSAVAQLILWIALLGKGLRDERYYCVDAGTFTAIESVLEDMPTPQTCEPAAYGGEALRSPYHSQLCITYSNSALLH